MSAQLVQAAKTLKVGVYNNSPTLFMDEGGEVKGLFVDILSDIAKKEDWQLDYVFGHWTDVYGYLKNGDIDVLPAIAFSDKRAELFDYTDETVMANWAQIYTPANKSLASLLELQGKRVAVKAGDIHFAALKQLTNEFNIQCRFIEVEDYETIFEMLNAKYLDCGVVNRLFGERNEPHYNVQITPVIFNPIEMRYAEPKGRDREIIAVIDNYLVSYKYEPNSIYYQSVKRWLIDKTKKEIPPFFWYALVGTALVSAISFGATLLFKQQVKRRTRELTLVNKQLASEVTERKKAENEVRISGERINAFFTSINDAIFVHPLQEQGFAPFIEVNEIASERYGYTREEFLSMTVKDITQPGDYLEHGKKDNRKKLLEAGQLIFETVHIKKNGDTFPVEINSNIVDQNGTPVILAVVRDITDRINAQTDHEKLESQLQQAQKMESIGRLAGGVAHDFNNMLGVIRGNAELALVKVDSSNQLRSNLEEICKAAERSANLTRQLLAFARKQSIAPAVLDLNETVSGMLKMLQTLLGENITLTWRPGDIDLIKIDPGQIDQMLANLCVNARDAIENTGEIIIQTKNANFDTSECEGYAGLTPGSYVLLSVKDSGDGIDKQTLTKIFDPFFTTKELGKGTGLGLATIYGIIKQNKGFIYVDSIPGKGTTFNIYIPRYQGNIEVSETAKPTISYSGVETILLVEDEVPLLNIIKQMLNNAGFHVLSLTNPKEAVEIANQHAGEIDLLLTDVIMPHLSGAELSNELLLLTPELKCLFMSGYTSDTISKHGVLEAGVHFIQKPFSQQDLTVAVRQILDSPKTPILKSAPQSCLPSQTPK